MSRQLKLSATLSALAMTLFAVAGQHAVPTAFAPSSRHSAAMIQAAALGVPAALLPAAR